MIEDNDHTHVIVLSPLGLPPETNQIDVAGADERGSLTTLDSKRVAFLWGMHDLSVKSWPIIERQVISTFHPREVVRHHKTEADDGIFKGNTWIPAPIDQIDAIAPAADWAVCGVGA